MVLLADAALRGLDALLHAVHVTLRERAEQRLLRREVVEQPALADAGRLGHDIEGQARRADLGDHSFRGFQDPVASRTGHRMCFYHRRFFLELDSSEIRGLYRLDGMLTVQPVQLQADRHGQSQAKACPTGFFCIIASRAGIE